MTLAACRGSPSTAKQTASSPKATGYSSQHPRRICTLPTASWERLCASMSADIAVHTDSGRLVEFHLKNHPHLDHGYAITSHSSQGQTADRVLVHADTEESAHLVNSRMAYVAVSRGRYDAQIYTNDKSELAECLSRDVSHRTAIQTGQQ